MSRLLSYKIVWSPDCPPRDFDIRKDDRKDLGPYQYRGTPFVSLTTECVIDVSIRLESPERHLPCAVRGVLARIVMLRTKEKARHPRF